MLLLAPSLFYFYVFKYFHPLSTVSHYSREVKRMILKKQVSSCFAAPGNTRLPSCLFLCRVCALQTSVHNLPGAADAQVV